MPLPVNELEKLLAVAAGQGFDVWDDEAIVFGIADDLSSPTEVLSLALTPAHRELFPALLSRHIKLKIAVSRFNRMDPVDHLQ